MAFLNSTWQVVGGERNELAADLDIVSMTQIHQGKEIWCAVGPNCRHHDPIIQALLSLVPGQHYRELQEVLPGTYTPQGTVILWFGSHGSRDGLPPHVLKLMCVRICECICVYVCEYICKCE